MIRRLFILALSSLLVTTALFSSVAGAASVPSTSSPTGLKVSPVRTELTMNAGQTEAVSVYVTNESSTAVTLQAIVDDFTSQGESGTPSLILNGQSTTHGLKQFIEPIKNVSIAAQQQLTVPVEVSIPKDTLGGGYYAAVRFAVAGGASPSQNVTLSASVATLILVQVNAPGLNQQLSLVSLKITRGSGSSGHFFIGSSGLDAVVRFNNSGNVQEAPYGKIIVQSTGQGTVMSQEVNNSTYPSNVLPGSSREFSVSLSGLREFGKYKVSGYFGYSGSSQLLSASTTIYVVSTWIIIVAGLILISLIAGIIWLVRHFKKRRLSAQPVDRAI